jgi:hypothetical protein
MYDIYRRSYILIYCIFMHLFIHGGDRIDLFLNVDQGGTLLFSINTNSHPVLHSIYMALVQVVGTEI